MTARGQGFQHWEKGRCQRWSAGMAKEVVIELAWRLPRVFGLLTAL
jgi:hypothetical protein